MSDAARRTAPRDRARCSRITACWGSTFFLIHDLLDRVPAARLPGGAVLDRRRSCCSLVAPRAVLRLSAAARRQAVVARRASTASRRSCRPPGSPTPPASVSGFITGMYVVATPLFAARAAAQPDHRG